MRERSGGAWALIVAAATMVGVMAVHPSHVNPAPFIGPFGYSGVVHSVAILAHVLFAYGAWALSRFLGLDRAAPGLAFAFALLAAVAMINAAVISTFATPAAVMTAAAADPASRALLMGQAHIWVTANRGFAQVDVALLSFALVLWGWAWPRASMTMRLGGIGIGLGVLAWQLSGSFEPNTHTMPIVALVQGIWLIAAGLQMLKRDPIQEEIVS